uniref:Uncharacterized protein n=1 Tax=Aegilops tauschii subsp. strangulata TaxID=200361 RepID=A0A453I4S4_AEGTS
MSHLSSYKYIMQQQEIKKTKKKDHKQSGHQLRLCHI